MKPRRRRTNNGCNRIRKQNMHASFGASPERGVSDHAAGDAGRKSPVAQLRDLTDALKRVSGGEARTGVVGTQLPNEPCQIPISLCRRPGSIRFPIHFTRAWRWARRKPTPLQPSGSRSPGRSASGIRKWPPKPTIWPLNQRLSGKPRSSRQQSSLGPP